MGRGGTLHFKWDNPGKGNHTAMCWKCMRSVTWTATGKIKR